MTGPRDEFGEILHALVTGDVVDGVPIISTTIGQLMHEHRDALEAMLTGDGDGDPQ